MSVDTSQIATARRRARRAPRDDGRVGHPRRARGRADRGLPAGGDGGTAARRVRGDRARDGRGRELQQRLGGARQAGLGLPLPPGGPPHRRLRRVRDRLEGRRGRHALEARRRGRRALQPGLLRGRRGARAGPAGGAVAADLGLRDDLGLVRPVLQGPGPAAAAQAHGAGLGGGRLLRADVLHRLPHAGRPGAPAGGPPRADLGRAPAASACSPPSSASSPAPTRVGVVSCAEKGELVKSLGARRLHRPQRVRRDDAHRRRGLRRGEGALQGVAALRQGGRGEARRRARHRLRARRAGHVPDLACSSSSRSARS